MKRLFCAVKIHITNEILDSIVLFQNELKDERIKWVNTDNLHLTLKFFGDTGAESEAEIINALNKAGEVMKAFSFNLAGLGYFGPRRSPRVLWIGIKQPAGLQILYKHINKYLTPLGYTPDKPNFVPHLTVGRIKDLKNINSFHNLLLTYEDKNYGAQHIDSFALYQSILRPQGPEYHVVKKWILNG